MGSTSQPASQPPALLQLLSTDQLDALADSNIARLRSCHHWMLWPLESLESVAAAAAELARRDAARKILADIAALIRERFLTAVDAGAAATDNPNGIYDRQSDQESAVTIEAKARIVAWTSRIAASFAVEIGSQLLDHIMAALISSIRSDLQSSPSTEHYVAAGVLALLQSSEARESLGRWLDQTTDTGVHNSLDSSHLQLLLETAAEIVVELDASKQADQSPAASEALTPYISGLLIVSLIFVVHANPRIRAVAGNSILPASTKWILASLKAKGALKWVKFSWSHITHACLSLSLSHPIHDEIQGYLCRLFDPWMGLERRAAGKYDFDAANVLLDLRREQLVFQLIQRGLRGQDLTALKYSQFLLKRIVYFSESYHPTRDASAAWSPYFTWPLEAQPRALAVQMLKMWEEYFLLFETVQEQYVHLIEPQLPKIASLLRTRSFKDTSFALHESWWITLVERGIQNRSHPIRKRMLDLVVSVRDPQLLKVLASNLDFTAGFLIERLDEPSQFAVPGLGIFLSPVGEMLSELVAAVATTFTDSTACVRCVTSTFA
eukprot:jgi/Hompol1/140/HPOL_005261-RA